MKRWVRGRANDEQGVVLMMVLGFMACVGVMAVALGHYATTNIRATINLRDTRGIQVSASGAVNLALNAESRIPAACPSPVTLNGNTFTVSCTPRVLDPKTYDFAATLTSGSPPRVVLAASAKYWPSGTVQITSWSVKK